MKLYTSSASPFGRKAAAFALEKGISLEIVQVELGSPTIARMNPLGQVPYLERDDGTIVIDSSVIVELFDATQPPTLRGEGEQRITMGVWEAVADGIVENTIKRMLELRREPEHQSRSVIVHAARKIARILDSVEARVGSGHLVGDTFSIADLALCCSLDYLDLRFAHDWRSNRPKLAAFVERVGARPSLAATRPPS